MDSFRPTKRLPIIIMMNFSIMCLNATLNIDKVYYMNTSCEHIERYHWCYDFLTPNDTANETMSRMFEAMCYNTTQCDLSSIKDMSTGRYLLEYSCVKPQTDTDIPRGDHTTVIITTIIGVGISILLFVGTTVIFIRRRKEPDTCDDGQTVPMDSYQNMYDYGQDHVYDQLQAASDDTAINEGTYNTAIDNAFVLGAKNELEDAQVEGSITDSQVKTNEAENAYEEVK